eukprot:Nitzschia sp. Nitz4//scaffold230_size58257//49981//51289//NITZ4_006488-RA/size58257-processed-gene-0.53-mRNA-1//1//CDS//3329543271//9145//frame0
MTCGKGVLSLCLLQLAFSSLAALSGATEAQPDKCIREGEASASRVLGDDPNGCYDDEDLAEYSFTGITSPAPQDNEQIRLGEDFGVAQTVTGSDAQAILDLLVETREYLQNVVMVDDEYLEVRELCENKNENCAMWSLWGECEANPAYMLLNCAPVCKACDMLHIENRCPMDPDAVDALYPGDVDKLFERIANDPFYKQFDPVVLSEPPLGPWMIMFENALSDEEADRLIELGQTQGYQRSSDVGTRNQDGTYSININSGRTSTNAWCQNECMEDPVAQRVMARIANITGIPETNSEHLQLLRYEKDQFYNVHSDYIPHQIERPTGVRILTYYMYLNDVEEGGGTNFPQLKKTVTPKKGRAVLWPSVFNDHPNQRDSRTNHQALPVIQGVKYGANAWIHQRDYKSPNQYGC